MTTFVLWYMVASVIVAVFSGRQARESYAKDDGPLLVFFVGMVIGLIWPMILAVGIFWAITKPRATK